MAGLDSQVLDGLEVLDVGIGIFDAGERLVHCNRRFRELRRYPEALCQPGTPLEAMIRFNAERGDFGPGDTQALIAERLAEIAQAGAREVEREMADGQVLRIRYRRTSGGGRVISFQDCTAERRAEAALKASEERYALVSEAAEEAIYEWDIAEGRFYASPRLREFLGRELGGDGIRDWNWDEIVHPGDIAHYRATLDRHLAGAAPRWSCEYRLKDAAGAWRWVSDHGTSVRGADGAAVRMVAAIRDITERVDREAALAASEERHTLVTRATSDGIYDWNVTEDRLYVSDNLIRILDFDLTSRASNAWAERVHRDDYDAYVGAIRAHFRGETEALECEYRVRGARGGYRWIQDRGIGVRGADGRVVRMVGAVRDISEMKAARAEIGRTEARLASALATISDGLLLVDAENRVQLWNDRYYEIFTEAARGADLSAVICKDRPFFDMIRDGYDLGMFKPHPDGVDAWVAARIKAWSQPASQWELELANGSWILLNERETPDGGRVSVYTDITELKRREADAQAARQRFEEAIEAISAGFSLWDSEDRLVICNSTYREFYADFADVVQPGAHFRDVLGAAARRGLIPAAEDDPEGYLEENYKQREAGIGILREHRLSNGRWLHITDHRTSDGGIVSIHTDVTELKRREEEIRKQAAILEATLENMGQGITMVDKDLRTVAFNRKFFELMQFPEDRFGRGFSMEDAFRYNAERGEYGPGDVEEQVRERLTLAGRFQPHRFERTRPDGTVLEIVGNPIDGGGLVATYTDITERKRADQALKAALAEFNAVLDTIDYGVLFMDADLNARICNRAFRKIWNIPEGFVEANPSMRALIEYNRDNNVYPVAPEDWDRWVDGRVAAIKAGEIPPGEMARADGMVLRYQCVALPDGGRMLTYFDITEMKRAEQVVRESEAGLQAALAEFDTVIENIDYGILFMDADLKVRIVNRAVGRIWGIPQEFVDAHPNMRELIEYNRDKGVYDVADEDWDEWLDNRVAAIRAGPVPPTEVLRADGKAVRYQCVALPDGGRMLTYFDITEMKRAEQVARASEIRLRGVLENSPIGVAVIRDTDNVILFHNARFAEVLRGPGEDLVGVQSQRFWTDLEERAKAREIFERDGRVVNREVMYRGMDGSDVWSLSTYERANWEGEPARLIWLFDVTQEKANREALVVARDEAQAALADLQKAQARLVQAEKMASLGQLTAGIAHEIKNPLNFVNNFAKLSDELLGELAEILAEPIGALDPEARDDAEDLLATVRENLTKINQHGRRADSIVKNMLLHSREGPSQVQQVRLNAIAEEALNLAYHGARAENPKFNIEMTKALDPEVGEIACYPQDLMRVLLNLITNGMYAANKRAADGEPGYAPRIAVATRCVDDRVEIEVRDNGTGIPAEVREKIFVPFFTTKPAGEGTGLGLSLSYDIVVKQHGGDLTVESEPGAFTAFRVVVPRCPPATGGSTK